MTSQRASPGTVLSPGGTTDGRPSARVSDALFLRKLMVIALNEVRRGPGPLARFAATFRCLPLNYGRAAWAPVPPAAPVGRPAVRRPCRRPSTAPSSDPHRRRTNRSGRRPTLFVRPRGAFDIGRQRRSPNHGLAGRRRGGRGRSRVRRGEIRIIQSPPAR
jgi:hypothetical protein